jgi:ATP-dependent DNA helicase RecG
MRTRILTEAEVLDAATREESHFYDKKGKEISGKQVQKIAVAFANADGGEFVIGLADDKAEPTPAKRWQGANNLEELNSHLQVLFQVVPTLDVHYETLRCETRQGLLLRVTIEKTAEVHKTSDGTVYQRHGAQSLRIDDPQKITELAFAKGASSFEDQLLKTIPTEQVVEGKELQSFLADYSPQTEPLDFCINQNLVDYNTWETRVAAALLFHPSPSAVMPRKCAVKISRYETKEDDPERDHLGLQKTVEGPLNALIHQSVKEIKEIMQSVTIWTATGLKNAEYPPEFIWEISLMP